MVRFYAVPVWSLIKKKQQDVDAQRLDVAIPIDSAAVLQRCEYRDYVAFERAEQLLRETTGPQVFAQPPNDLPALLRTADQLLAMSKQEIGEKSRIWRCTCGCHYAVPVALVRPVAIRCDRCGRTLELEAGSALGTPGPVDEANQKLAAERLALSEFFREAMARGWPVLVANE